MGRRRRVWQGTTPTPFGQQRWQQTAVPCDRLVPAAEVSLEETLALRAPPADEEAVVQ